MTDTIRPTLGGVDAEQAGEEGVVKRKDPAIDQGKHLKMREVTTEQMRADPRAVSRLPGTGPVAVMHEGRAVAFLGVDSTPRVVLDERDEDFYVDDGTVRGDAAKALAAAVQTGYWNG